MRLHFKAPLLGLVSSKTCYCRHIGAHSKPGTWGRYGLWCLEVAFLDSSCCHFLCAGRVRKAAKIERTWVSFMYCSPSDSTDFYSSFCHGQKPPESAETFVVVVAIKESFKSCKLSQFKELGDFYATFNQEGSYFRHSNDQVKRYFCRSTVEPTFGMAFNCMEKSDMLFAV